ncbi:hypothetical protein J2Z79_001308 [Symbiobacterium terraclitae]|uniref:Lipoprotein n=1 Tax=Symbiobacterium terraclitae TaxID=557451 RepID=A0ABS4JQV4_9FIRM|nr:hypothetical protein [Symbiobacterium terraclitae]MBP2017922.1 hypothetical protein [Symbiobacterium terraclitae]
MKRCMPLLAALVLLHGCSSVPTPQQVTEAQARSFFDQAVHAALTHDDVTTLCDLAGSRTNCLLDLERLQERTPTEAPEILCTYELPSQQTERAALVGGQVLVVAGADGKGDPYQTEVLVFHDGQDLKGTNIVWWSNRGIGAAKLVEDGEGNVYAMAATAGPEERDPCRDR